MTTRMLHGTRGRYSHGCRCDACRVGAARYERERKRAIKAGTWIPHSPRPEEPLLSFAPLAEFLSDRGLTLYPTFPGRSDTVLRRWQQWGLTELEADETAVELGVNPRSIWGLAYKEAI